MAKYDKLISDLLGNAEKGRFDCPICGKRNTLSVSRQGGVLLYHCFVSSCELHGKVETGLPSPEYLEKLLTAKKEAPFHIPEYFQHPYSADAAVDFIVYYALDKLMVDRRLSLRYDPREHRLVFLIPALASQGEDTSQQWPVDAVGRTLNKSYIDRKWKMYGTGEHPYVIQTKAERTETLLLVEDAVSAAKSSYSCDTCALLGTNITYHHIPIITRYDRVVLALDEDATTKAVKYLDILSGLTKSARVVMLQRDLKEEPVEDIAKIVGV